MSTDTETRSGDVSVSLSQARGVLPGIVRAHEAGLITHFEHVESLFLCYTGQPDHPLAHAYDLTRVMVEETCKSILGKHGSTARSGWNITKQLLPATLDVLNLTPSNHDGSADQQLENLATGLDAARDGISQVAKAIDVMRHTQGFSSHANSVWFTHEQPQVEIVVRSADALIGFLTDVHMNYRALPRYHRPEYQHHAQANEQFDELYEPFTVWMDGDEVPYAPSRVLYAVDLDAYKALVLGGFVEEMGETGEEGEPE